MGTYHYIPDEDILKRKKEAEKLADEKLEKQVEDTLNVLLGGVILICFISVLFIGACVAIGMVIFAFSSLLTLFNIHWAIEVVHRYHIFL